MEECIYSVEFEYDVIKHARILYKLRKKGHVFSIIMLIGSILFYIGTIINSSKASSQGFVLLAVFFVIFALILLSSTSKRSYRIRLTKLYGKESIKFKYKFYDEYVLITRIGDNYESISKMKYNNLIRCGQIEDRLGYILTKEQTLLFISGDKTNEIVTFIEDKIFLNNPNIK